jgi:RNA polymerase subunit RPABC4/transcription elongation factor Spt4
MCGFDDRICSRCGHPFQAQSSPYCKSGLTPEEWDMVSCHCPKCGMPSTINDRKPRSVISEARNKKGLVP